MKRGMFLCLAIALAGCYQQAAPPAGYVPAPRAKELADAAKIALDAGQLDDALAKANEAAQIDPGFAGAFTYKGYIQLRRSEANAAKESFLKAISLDAAACDAALFYGLVTESEGDETKAREYYQRAARCYADAAAKQGAGPEKLVYQSAALFLGRGQMESVTFINNVLESHPEFRPALLVKSRIVADDRAYFLRWASPTGAGLNAQEAPQAQ